MGERLRVVQWATGHIGRRALREVIRHPALDLVGVLVYDPEKDGVDAGELCSEASTGITATTNRAAMLAVDADCALYMPRASGAGANRAGLTDEELLDDVATLLESGTNVITTCTPLFGGCARMGEAGRERVLAACERGRSSLYATGSSPGFNTDAFPFALLSMQRQVESVEIEEFGDLSRRDSPHMLFEQMRFGKPLGEFDPNRRARHLLDEYGPSLRQLAEAAGLVVDEWTAFGEVAAARHDTKIVAGEIPAGTAAAQRATVAGRRNGVDVVSFTPYSYCTTEIDPAWELQRSGWRVRVCGDAPFDVQLGLPFPLDQLGSYVPAYSANRPVNAIPYVCAAPPGIVFTEDLPPIMPAGPRSERE
jgi:4-hydroxy-tetrahydrodipicolinate reductase